MRVVISGGGTGGHLFPALTLALALKYRGDEVIFIGAKNRVEERIVPLKGLKFHAIDVIGLHKSFKGVLNFITKQHKAINNVKKILTEFKPHVVIGWGGYASFATLISAARLKIPTIIHEQNAFMGRANYLLSLKADKKLVCYQGVVKNEIVVGNPRASEARKYYHRVNNERKIILFVMGSQGSSSVNKIINEYLNIRKKDYEIVIICGKGHLSLFEQADLEGVKLLEFSNEILSLFNQVDVVVTRGGATTLSELAVLKKPSIIIPSPYVYKNHQIYNAKYYEENQGAIILEENNLDKEKLKTTIEELILDNDRLEKMKKNMATCAHPYALEAILRIVDSYDNSK